MIDQQQVQQAQQVAMPIVNWSVNVWDLVGLAGVAIVLYSRLTTLETKVQPIWDWWNSVTGDNPTGHRRRRIDHLLDRNRS